MIIDDNTSDDTVEFIRLVASTVRAMRQSLGVTVEEMANASGVLSSRIEAIEGGAASTRAERHDLAVGVAWLSNICVAKRLTTKPQAVPRVGPE
jgi:DNA-binding XRE family transcriptional regulator